MLFLDVPLVLMFVHLTVSGSNSHAKFVNLRRIRLGGGHVTTRCRVLFPEVRDARQHARITARKLRLVWTLMVSFSFPWPAGAVF